MPDDGKFPLYHYAASALEVVRGTDGDILFVTLEHNGVKVAFDIPAGARVTIEEIV